MQETLMFEANELYQNNLVVMRLADIKILS